MSGIIGLYYLDGRSASCTNLKQMVDQLSHRGPDGAHMWCQGQVGLGHRLLWTTPESLLETLPLVSQSGNFVITTDLRIDNRDDLISGLGLNHQPAAKVTDSQIVLAAYEKWGERCPEYLLGAFAFAVWDRPRQRLFCARDHFGVKPFYYHYRQGQAFLFASEIKALTCLPEVPYGINEIRIADYLYPMLEDKTITAYQGIFRLPPGHTLSVGCNLGLSLRTYWQLEIGNELHLQSDQAYADAFLERFSEAVKCRLRSAFPVGSHLSGGLDSSAVACVARNILTQEQGIELHTFSNVFDQVAECDERAFIEPVLAQGGFIPHFVHPDQTGPLTHWTNFFSPQEEPCLIGGNGYLVWGLNRATQQANVRVCLDGFDGDTTVSHGIGYFAELARQGQWQQFAVEADAVSQHFDTSPASLLNHYGFLYLQTLARQWRWFTFAQTINGIRRHFRVSRRQLWFRLGFRTLIPDRLVQLWRSLRGYKPPSNCSTLLLNPDFAARIDIKERLQQFVGQQDQALTPREDQWQILTSGTFVQVLEHLDLSAAAYSIESRHPFMDKRLIEFCMALPSPQKLHQGWSRIVMRRALNNILPQQVQWRGSKTDMTPNFLYGLLTYNRTLLDQVLLSQLNDSDTRIADYLDLRVLGQSYNRLVSDSNVTDIDITIIWRAIGLGLWLRQATLPP